MHVFSSVKKQILQYQSGSIGLFPLHTSGKNEESHVRDNVYCAMAVWALGLAYRFVYELVGPFKVLHIFGVLRNL